MVRVLSVFALQEYHWLSILLLYIGSNSCGLYTIWGYHSININLSQMTYFYIICLYLKLKLRNANNSITKSFDRKFKMTNYKMKNILKSLDSIISEINIHNNDFWSKYLMFVLMLVILFFDMLLFESLFGKMSLFHKIILFYASIAFFLLLIILINTASSVSFEANKSYKLLNKLFITIGNNKQIWIRIKIKVWILIINVFLILTQFLTIFLLSIFSQLFLFIERIGWKKIGFYCWQVFIFHYFPLYKVSFQKIWSNLINNCLNSKFLLFDIGIDGLLSQDYRNVCSQSKLNINIWNKLTFT